MEEITIKSTIHLAQLNELSAEERSLVEQAIEATQRSYAHYSKFRVGAAVLLENGVTLLGCNQENASFPAGTCAERAAIFAAGAQFPDTPIKMIAIAARTPDGELQEGPISPCGICRQVIVETETRHGNKIRILLYGKRGVYVVDGIETLMPLCFTEF
mgnify:FL=1